MATAPAWLASDFQDLNDSLIALAESRDVNIPLFADVLDSSRDELKKLLQCPGKSDESRKKIQSAGQSGKLQLQEDEYGVNAEFVQTTIELADELRIDELVAAELLVLGGQEADKLDRKPAQAAIFIFHSRRQTILECLRLIFSLSLADFIREDVKSKLLETTLYITGASQTAKIGGFASKCIDAMAELRNDLKGLEEKSRNAAFHHLNLVEGFLEDLKLRATFLSNQHQSLGASVHSLVQHKQCSAAELEKMKSNLRSHKDYDVLLVHQIPAFIGLIDQLTLSSAPLKSTEIKKIHDNFLKSSKEEKWDLQYVHAATHLWWYAAFNGYVRDSPRDVADSLKVDYMTDIHEPSRSALADGALDFMMAVVCEVNQPEEYDAAREHFRIFLQNKTPFNPQTPMGTTAEFRHIFLSQMELFMDNFISNMADLLKEIKNNEEEDDLLHREGSYDLERFFFLISSLFYNRPEAGMTFWSDRESNLFGFLVWASHRQTPLMAAAYCDVLASLSHGTQSAEATDAFLSEELSSSSSKLKKTTQISWDFIFQSLQYYAKELRPRNQEHAMMVHYRGGLPQPQEPNELSAESVRVVDSYLRLITQITRDCKAAKDRLYGNPNAKLLPTYLEFLEANIPKMLLASLFKTITAFCGVKSEIDSGQAWAAIDKYIMGAPTAAVPTASMSVSTRGQQGAAIAKLESIGEDFPATEAFLGLLKALVARSSDAVDNALPFPENLGSSNRLPGIDPYIDFAMRLLAESVQVDKVTGFRRWPENQISVLQLRCLEFIYTSLVSFNEQLIVIANSSNVVVDEAMPTANLASYVKLHPFARIMDHLFSETVLSALFKIVGQSVERVATIAEESSPIVRTVFMIVELMNYIMDKETTYLEVVRPEIWRDESNARKKSVATVGLSSFEDAVLYNLSIIVHLGNYAGMQQHVSLSLVCLQLLTKLSISPKLISSPSSLFDRQIRKNRVLSVTDQEGESRRIAFGLISQLDSPPETCDAENLPDWPYTIKLAILRFLEASLVSQPNEASLAHQILGFSTNNGSIELNTEPSGIGSGVSVFHSILNILSVWDERDESGKAFDVAQCKLKAACFRVLRALWQSKLASSDTLYVLRENKFLYAQFSQDVSIGKSTTWGSQPFNSIAIFSSGNIEGCIEYLYRRTATFDYIALEIRQMSIMGASGTIRDYFQTLTGVTDAFGDRLVHGSVLDLLDFLELDPEDDVPQPTLQWFGDLNFSSCQSNDNGVIFFDIEGAQELLNLRRVELRKLGRFNSEQEENVDEEIETIISYFHYENYRRRFRIARVECLRYWCRLIVIILECARLDSVAKTSFIFQTLQTILPKLEQYSGNDIQSAEELSSLAQSLITHLTFDTATLGKGRASDVANDKLYQMFRTSLRCIQSPIATPALREDFYSVVHRYLVGMQDVSLTGSVLSRHSIQTIRASGERLLEVLCNDAYVGSGNCKVLALLVLDALVHLAQEENSSYILDVLIRQNFVVVIVQTLKHLNREFEQVRDAHVIAAVKATTGLLLRISRTKDGASAILNAGFFQVLNESGLFSVDPDLGFGLPGEKGLAQYYELLQAFVRVLVSCLLSRGAMDKLETEQCRRFLSSNTNLVSSILKRHAGIGSVISDAGNLGSLVELFVLLYCLTDLLEPEDHSTNHHSQSFSNSRFN